MSRFFLLLVFFASYSFVGCSQTSMKGISYLLGKKQEDKTGQFKKLTFFQVREKLFWKYPSIFNYSIDSAFFVETYEVEDASYYGTIWTKKDTINYVFFANEIKIVDKRYFNDKTLSLVSAWETAAIEKEEELYPSSYKTVHAARCRVKDRRCIIDVIQMKDLIFD